MVRKVITVKEDASLEEVITLMNRHEIGCLIVTKEKKPVGIITERDLLKRVLADIPELPHISVQQVMSKPVKTGKPDMELQHAVSLMVEQKIKKLPVTHDGKLVGLITLTDILRFQPQLIRIYKILSTDVVPPRMKKVFDYYTLLYPDDKGILEKNVSI
jgi:CBS domain-containing protein